VKRRQPGILCKKWTQNHKRGWNRSFRSILHDPDLVLTVRFLPFFLLFATFTRLCFELIAEVSSRSLPHEIPI
jgi:hypothetical protein